jgi:hypothetical protein
VIIIIVARMVVKMTLKQVAALLNSSPAGSQSGLNFSFNGDVFRCFSANLSFGKIVNIPI